MPAPPPGRGGWHFAGVLVTLGVMRLVRHGHPRWARMRVRMGGLTLWSFLMATAHGAGLMVVPVFVGMTMAGGEHAHHHAPEAGAGAALLATGLHASGYLAVTAFVALLVFEKLGVGLLRRAWVNLDLIWASARRDGRADGVAVADRSCGAAPGSRPWAAAGCTASGREAHRNRPGRVCYSCRSCARSSVG